MSTKETREEWIRWLMESRMISAAMIIDAGLGIDVEGGELAIPVYAPDGEFLFHKYRRSPWNKNGPKYRYTSGSSAALYGAELLKNLNKDEDIVITEGELDALALRSLGQMAVSSTGGSGTWREEWSQLITAHKPVICYDADLAGVEGAMRVAMTFPQGVRIAWIPPQYGKDPTEALVSGGAGKLGEVIQCANTYKVPARGTDGRLKALSALLKQFVTERKAAIADPEGTPLHLNFAINWVEKEIKHEKVTEERPVRGPVSGEMSERLAAARAYPIKDLIKVGRGGFALCPFHTETTPSFQVYRDNHAYCFGGCAKRFDSIDIYAKLNNIDLSQKGAMKKVIDALI
jgi:hypothetical protein